VTADPLFDEAQPDRYVQVMLVVVEHALLLADPRLARQVCAVLAASRPDAPGTLWGYTVLPDSVRLIVGPTGADALDRFVATVKARTAARLLHHIRRADDDSLDVVLRYNPVWGGAIFQVWQAGYHRQDYTSEYKLSNALYDLLQLPVAEGLVDDAHAWPYTWISGAEW
jgi:hypothetical protein